MSFITNISNYRPTTQASSWEAKLPSDITAIVKDHITKFGTEYDAITKEIQKVRTEMPQSEMPEIRLMYRVLAEKLTKLYVERYYHHKTIMERLINDRFQTTFTINIPFNELLFAIFYYGNRNSNIPEQQWDVYSRGTNYAKAEKAFIEGNMDIVKPDFNDILNTLLAKVSDPLQEGTQKVRGCISWYMESVVQQKGCKVKLKHIPSQRSTANTDSGYYIIENWLKNFAAHSSLRLTKETDSLLGRYGSTKYGERIPILSNNEGSVCAWIYFYQNGSGEFIFADESMKIKFMELYS